MKNFALIGIGGYIAPRHLRAIKETGNVLIAALDIHDSVGIIDSYFPSASFFTEFERFDRYLEKLRLEKKQKIDYLSICSPNYLHDSHIRFGLRIGANIICEKPLVLNPWNLDALEKLENKSEGKINTILQLRLQKSLIKLKKEIDASSVNKKFDVNLLYVSSRGTWYDYSWKGDLEKSGGVATNIGVHLFDLLCWLFGSKKRNVVNLNKKRKVSGCLELERANINWTLSVNSEDLPSDVKESNKTTYRSITVDGKEIEFSSNFTELHVESYKGILEGKGFGIEDIRPSIEIVSEIRSEL